MNREITGVEHHIGLALEFGHPLSFETDPLENGAFRSEGMGSTALAEPPEQDLISCFEEKDTDSMSVLSQNCQDLLKRAEERSFPNVDNEGNPVDVPLRVGAQVRDSWDQGSGKVVDTKNTQVFQSLDCLALAGTRHPCNNDELHRFSADNPQLTSGKQVM